jgi:predicted ABC-type ATPase
VIADVFAAVRRAIRVRAGPVLVFLAGPNGAGNSTFFRQYLEDLGLPFLNADLIAGALHDAAPMASIEDFSRLAFEKTEDMRNSLLAEHVSFCTETVFSDPLGAKLDFLRRARSSGYAVFLVFIGLSDPELSIARVMQRVQAGGHDVPDEKLRARFPRTMSNLLAAIPLVDEAFLFDNSSDLDPFRPVAIYSYGRLITRKDPLPHWTAGLPGL